MMNRDLDRAMREDAEQTGMVEPGPGRFEWLVALIVISLAGGGAIVWLLSWAFSPASLP